MENHHVQDGIFVPKVKTSTFLKKLKKLIINEVQKDSFGEEIEQLRNEQPIKKGNAIEKLNPFMD